MSRIVHIEALANQKRIHLSCGHVDVRSRAAWRGNVGDQVVCPVCFGRSLLDCSDTVPDNTNSLRLKLEAEPPPIGAVGVASLDSAPIRLRTADHPLAGGRRPRPGERTTAFLLTLDDGRSLALEVGDASRAQIERTLLAIMRGFNTFQPDPQEDR